MAKPKFINLILLIFLTIVLISAGFVVLNESAGVDSQDHSPEINSKYILNGNRNTLKDSIVEYGMELIDTPYVIAGSNTKGFDCSGYVYHVFRNFNIDVPRSTSEYGDFGKEIPVEEVEKGDLLLFLSPTRNAIGHIGIVSTANGANSEFIHASSGGAMKVIITSLSNDGYTRRFVKAVRVL